MSSKSTVVMSVTFNTSAATLFAGCLVVVAGLDRSRAQDVVQIVAIWLLVNPFTDCIEHVSVDFDTLIAKSWMMEYSENISHHFIDWHSWVLPSIKDSAISNQQLTPKTSQCTHGVTYCKIVVATRPATPFSLFEKWSLESIE